MLTTREIGRLPSRDGRSRKLSPCTNGMGEYSSPSANAPLARSGTICGCCSCAATLISRLNRSRFSPSARSGCSTLMTTCRSSDASFATKTRDMPPLPSSRSSMYEPPNDDCRWSRRSVPMADECTVSCRIRRAAFSYGDAVKTNWSEPRSHSLLIRVIRVLKPWGLQITDAYLPLKHEVSWKGRRPHPTGCLTSVAGQERQHRRYERRRHRHLVMRDVR